MSIYWKISATYIAVFSRTPCRNMNAVWLWLQVQLNGTIVPAGLRWLEEATLSVSGAGMWPVSLTRLPKNDESTIIIVLVENLLWYGDRVIWSRFISAAIQPILYASSKDGSRRQRTRSPASRLTVVSLRARSKAERESAVLYTASGIVLFGCAHGAGAPDAGHVNTTHHRKVVIIIIIIIVILNSEPCAP